MKRIKKFNEGGMDYDSSDDAKNLILAAEREDVERIGEDFAKTLPKAQPKSSSFKEAFAEARKAGDKTFEWNGKKYTTEMAGDKKSKPAAKSIARMTDTGDEISRLMRRAPSPVPRTDLMRTSSNAPKLGMANFKSGGKVSSASKRADGCAVKGKTRGRMI